MTFHLCAHTLVAGKTSGAKPPVSSVPSSSKPSLFAAVQTPASSGAKAEVSSSGKDSKTPLTGNVGKAPVARSLSHMLSSAVEQKVGEKPPLASGQHAMVILS